MDRFDVIIIGAGHNGLTAAAFLAKKGKSVCVLEKSDQIGGMAANSEIVPGVSAPRVAHLAYNLNSVVMKELGLEGQFGMTPLPTIALSPDGRHIEIGEGAVTNADGHAHPDAPVFLEIRDQLKKFARILAPLALKPPPDLSGGIGFSNLSETVSLVRLGLNIKRLGKKDMREFMRITLSNIYDLLMDDLDDGPLAGALAADAVLGNWAGPRSPGTVLSLMYRYGQGGQAALPKDGMGGLTAAIADLAKKHGAEVRTSSAVKNILIDNDRVTGLVLEDGSHLESKAVMSSAGARQSMLMAGVEHFDVEAVRRIRNIRAKGTTAKVNILLQGTPDFKGLTENQLAGRLLIAPSARYVEQGFNAVKYGEMAKAPVIEAVIPTLSGPGIDNGRHILSAIVQYIPYHLRGGWNKAARDRLTEITLDTLSIYAPDIRGQVSHIETLSPADIERETGAPGGHWHHAELSTDQMLHVRPVNLLSRYAFGVEGLFLCGAGAHPGGDVSGAAGRNAALQVIKSGVLS